VRGSVVKSAVIQRLQASASLLWHRGPSVSVQLSSAQSVASCFKMLNVEVTAKLFWSAAGVVYCRDCWLHLFKLQQGSHGLRGRQTDRPLSSCGQRALLGRAQGRLTSADAWLGQAEEARQSQSQLRMGLLRELHSHSHWIWGFVYIEI